jgi:hypothetical protein
MIQRNGPPLEVYDILTRIMKDGSTTQPVEAKQRKHGWHVGTAHVITCFLCRKHLNEDGQTEYKETVWWCKNCHMPLCKTNLHIDQEWHTLTCVEVHVDSTDIDIG